VEFSRLGAGCCQAASARQRWRSLERPGDQFITCDLPASTLWYFRMQASRYGVRTSCDADRGTVMPTSSTYRDQITVSGKERHQNIWMHRIGVGQEDHIGLFANHFMRNQSGLSTTFLTLESLFKLHGPAFAKPVRPPCKPDLHRNFVTNEISTCPEQAGVAEALAWHRG